MLCSVSVTRGAAGASVLPSLPRSFILSGIAKLVGGLNLDDGFSALYNILGGNSAVPGFPDVGGLGNRLEVSRALSSSVS